LLGKPSSAHGRGKGAIKEAHGGLIVSELFDVDRSRSIPPQRQPVARAVPTALVAQHCGFDAVVIADLRDL
jgi:hypothetical protein